MATLPHDSLPDSPPSQNAGGDEHNQALKAPVSSPRISTDGNPTDVANETTEQPTWVDQERLKAECSSLFTELSARVMCTKSDCNIFLGHLQEYKKRQKEVSADATCLRLSPLVPGILIQATDSVRKLTKVNDTLVSLDSINKQLIAAMSTLKAYFDQLNELEQEAEEICEKSLGANHQSVNGLHESYPRSHRAAIFYWTRSLKNKILMQARSCW